MSADLFRQLRRVEAQAERGFEGTAAEGAERRRRLRLELLRQHLAQNVDFLKAAHLGGASGQQSVQAYAAFMDGFLSTLFRLAVDDAKKEGAVPGPIVLVALGGYGRGELGPLSDLDLMVIYDGEMGPFVQRATQGLLYTLWDLGLTVGHSVRSLPDCVAMARTDFASRTSMQEARYVIGDRRLFQRFRRVLAENVYRKDFGQFLETALTERDQRYRKFGGSPYMGEPNVKESAGGLRDLHTAMWLASTKFGARTLRDLLEKRLITQREERQTDAALTFLWRVRNELHFLSGHKNDVLSRDIQPQIAKRFGYAARRGALIDTIVPGSAAASAGLRAGTRTEAFQGLGVRVGGDAIVAINGIPIADAEDVVRIVASTLLPGESARFSIVRGAVRRDVEVTLGERPPG